MNDRTAVSSCGNTQNDDGLKNSEMHKNRGDFNIHETLYKRIFVVENSYLDDNNVLHSKKEKKYFKKGSLLWPK